MQKKRVIIVFIAGLLIIAAIFTLINLKDIREKGAAGFIQNIFGSGNNKKKLDSLVINLDELNASDFEIYKDNIVCAGKDGIFTIDFKGKKVWADTSAGFLNPCIKTAGDYILVSETGGTGSVLYKNTQLIWKENFPDGIISADVSKDGYAVIVHNTQGYKTGVDVFKPASDGGTKGALVISNKTNSENIIAASISEKSGQLVLSGVVTDGEKITGSLTFIDMSNGNSYASVKMDDNVYPIIKYINDDTVIAANTNNLRKIRKSKTAGSETDFDKDLWIPYNKYKICSINAAGEYIVTSAEYNAASVYSQDTESIIQIMDINGKILKSLTLSGVVNKINIKGTVFTASSKNLTGIYNIKGEKFYDYKTLSDIQKVIIKDADNFAVITNKDINILTAAGK